MGQILPKKKDVQIRNQTPSHNTLILAVAVAVRGGGGGEGEEDQQISQKYWQVTCIFVCLLLYLRCFLFQNAEYRDKTYNCQLIFMGVQYGVFL